MSSPDGERRRKPANVNIGEVVCPTCGTTAYVRKKTTGKYYVNCPMCGLFQISFRSGQEWILSNARFYGPNGEASGAFPSQRPKIVNAPPPSPLSSTPMHSERDPGASNPVSAGTPPNVPATPPEPAPQKPPEVQTVPLSQPAPPTPPHPQRKKLSDLLL